MSIAHPVAIDPVGPVSVATVAWRKRGRLRVSVVVKATFAFAPSGAMPLAEPLELLRTEVHNGNNPMRSVRASGELAPYLPRSELTFVGSAHAPVDAPAARLVVRIAIAAGDSSPRPGEVLIDKRLEVHGERFADPGMPAPEGKPFSRMPLVYENALGGIGSPDNPLGTGVLPGDDRRVRWPNVVNLDPALATKPASFAPVSWSFPVRKRLLKGNRRTLEQRIAEIPDDFDDAYFHAAPVDQRFDALRGDERILLENLHPVHRRLELRLPGARALARAYDGYGQTTTIDLRADTIAIDGDLERCAVVWRGSFPFAREDALEAIRIAAGIELPGHPVSFPDPAVFRPVPREAAGNEAASPAPNLSATMSLSDDDLIIDAPLGGTLMLDDASSPPAPAPAHRPPPPPVAARPPAPPPAAGRAPSKHASTVALAPEEQQAAKTADPLPFAHGSSAAARSSAAPIPGAPWSGERAAPVPRPRGRAASTLPLHDAEAVQALADAIRQSDERLRARGAEIADEGTVSLDGEAISGVAAREERTSDAPEAPKAAPALPNAVPAASDAAAQKSEPVAAAPAPDPKPIVRERDPSKDPYGQVAPWAAGASADPAPAKPRPEPPKPSVRSKLYGKFGKK